MKDKIETQSLEMALGKRKSEFASTADRETKRIYAEGIAAVETSGILMRAKDVGDDAPRFALKNATGKLVNLNDHLKKGAVILTWYRGGWCPYCNITLQYLQNSLAEFERAGASLIALTPELPDRSLTTKEKHELTFEVLSDIGNSVARKYGIVFKLTDLVDEKYQNAFDMHAYNGDDSAELPLAATYVINEEGKIIYAYADADYRNRAEPIDIIKALKNRS